MADDFIDGFEDIPLMSDFKQLSSQNFSFSNEETGYTEAVIEAQKKISFMAVQTFYSDVLPKLGWKLYSNESEKISYVRENDLLELSLQKKYPLTISINLKSKN